ncbi:MAG: esterase/lipase family protein [Gammaproteobacteria bacterium]
MLRVTLLIVHFVELLLYTWLVHDSAVEGPLDWFVEVIGLALVVRLIIIFLTFVLARTPLQPLVISFSALASEYVSALYIFSFSALRSMPEAFTPTHTNPNHLPILFIHGFTCNAGFWRKFIAVLQPQWGARLATISLEPVHASIDDYATRIEQRMDELLAASDSRRCLVVAHSMGGLAIRQALRSAQTRGKVAGVVTLGTPHLGTRLADFSLAENSHQMRRHSDWLDQLRRDEKAYELPPFEALVGTHDNIVSPQQNAVFESGTNTYMTGISHLAMALNEQVIDWTLDRCARLAAQA